MPCSAVPVLPPILYPAICALFPVPNETTDSAYSNNLSAVSFDTACLTSVGSYSVTILPLLSVILFTIIGFINVPSFASALIAVINCNGVISNL